MADFLDESFGGATCAVLSEQEQPYVLAVIMTACYSLLKWQYESEKKNAKLNCS